MSILINRRTRVITQGMTGLGGRLHTARCRAYANGRKGFVAGVTPGKGGQSVDGVPVYDTVRAAKSATGANVSVVYVPPLLAAHAILEAVEAELDLVVCITTGMPEADMDRVLERMRGSRTRLLGPNCPGIVVPGEIAVGILPAEAFASGRIGVMSRTGARGPDIARRLAASGMGLSTVVGIGGDATGGLRFADVMELFNADPGTDGVLMVDELGANSPLDAAEERAFAQWIRDHAHKPIAALLLGSGPAADARAATMEACGVRVGRDVEAMGGLLASLVAPECLPFD
jgi:succinyl-CoA synthetase alpha subunit